MDLRNYTQVPTSLLKEFLEMGEDTVGCSLEGFPLIFQHTRRQRFHGRVFGGENTPPKKLEMNIPPVSTYVYTKFPRFCARSFWTVLLHELAHVRDMQKGDLPGPEGWTPGSDYQSVHHDYRPQEQRADEFVEEIIFKGPPPGLEDLLIKFTVAISYRVT